VDRKQSALRFCLLLLGLLWGCGGKADAPSRPEIRRPPAAWQASVPLRKWDYIVLHHSASETGSVESIDAEHRTRRDASGNLWRGIGYHFVVGNGHGAPDGEIESTFRWKDQSAGAHAGDATYNQRGIGICLIGNCENEPPTARQVESLRSLVGYLKAEFGIEANGVLRHGDLKATACPGKLFPASQIAQTPAWTAEAIANTRRPD
jgi:N-acetyl-anhydromuramyl-L-alanine amidase AmpD